MQPESYAAFWEFSARIITPTIERLIPDPSNCHAVELGYGDGRLLCPAASYFGRVTGVATDSTDDASDASVLNRSQPCDASRIELASTEADHSLPFEEASVDFIYSLHGVLRFPDLDSFRKLVIEIERVLRPGGVAMLWFGRISRFPFLLPGRDWLRGWAHRPIPETRNDSALHIRMYHARRAVLKSGMKAVSLSTPLHPDTSWRLLRGGPMSYVTAWKPPVE